MLQNKSEIINLCKILLDAINSIILCCLLFLCCYYRRECTIQDYVIARDIDAQIFSFNAATFMKPVPWAVIQIPTGINVRRCFIKELTFMIYWCYIPTFGPPCILIYWMPYKTNALLGQDKPSCTCLLFAHYMALQCTEVIILIFLQFHSYIALWLMLISIYHIAGH